MRYEFSCASFPPDACEEVPTESPVAAAEPVAEDCVPTDKCTISEDPQCQVMKDRFLAVLGGIEDKKAEIEEELKQKEEYCEDKTKTGTEQIEGEEEELRKEKGDLADATEDQNQAESGSHTQGEARDATEKQQKEAAKKCCETQNALKSELCALEKIRGELNNMNGSDVTITDCEVSDWEEGECSKTCGTGKVRSTRSVVTHPEGEGLSCPPLEKEDS